MRGRLNTALAIAALGMGLSAATTAADVPRPSPHSSNDHEKAAWARRPASRGWWWSKHADDGWSVRQGQRMAKKRRNQKRHRKACR